MVPQEGKKVAVSFRVDFWTGPSWEVDGSRRELMREVRLEEVLLQEVLLEEVLTKRC